MHCIVFCRFLFWSSQAKIERANVDGSGRIPIVVGLTKQYGLALDFDLERLYWCSSTNDVSSLEYVNFDGRLVHVAHLGVSHCGVNQCGPLWCVVVGGQCGPLWCVYLHRYV